MNDAGATWIDPSSPPSSPPAPLPSPLPSSRPVTGIAAGSTSCLPPLSAHLKIRTADAHTEVERRLQLPESISGLAEYKQLLVRFYRLYRPLEDRFGEFPEWLAVGIDPPERELSIRLAADLDVLGVHAAGLSDAPDASLPLLPAFPSALGALYVIEGSALGSQFILPRLQAVLGARIAGADTFFRGRGKQTGASWRRFRDALDAYGALHPELCQTVLQGAIDTFISFGNWMAP